VSDTVRHSSRTDQKAYMPLPPPHVAARVVLLALVTRPSPSGSVCSSRPRGDVAPGARGRGDAGVARRPARARLRGGHGLTQAAARDAARLGRFRVDRRSFRPTEELSRRARRRATRGRRTPDEDPKTTVPRGPEARRQHRSRGRQRGRVRGQRGRRVYAAHQSAKPKPSPQEVLRHFALNVLRVGVAVVSLGVSTAGRPVA
jgi:hypothetical protein